LVYLTLVRLNRERPEGLRAWFGLRTALHVGSVDRVDTLVNTIYTIYSVYMGKPEGTKALNINLNTELWEHIDKWRFREMFATRTEAIAWLLEWALKQNPKRLTGG
jgi:hypothetical protein